MIFASISLIVFGPVIAWVGVRSRHDRLPRNGAAGLRTQATMASDEAWYAAQRAGAGRTMLAGAFGFAGGVASLFFSTPGAAAIVLSTAAVILLLAVWAGVLGQRAAKEVLDR